jgi:hypothetical protein
MRACPTLDRVTTPDHDPEALSEEPLDYRAGAFYTLAFLLVPAWLLAAYLALVHGLIGIEGNALGLYDKRCKPL